MTLVRKKIPVREYVPVGMRIVVKPDEDKTMSDAGIAIPDQAKSAPLTGTVVAIGSDIKDELIHIGDRVFWGGMFQAKVPKNPGDEDRIVLSYPAQCLCIIRETERDETDDEFAARAAQWQEQQDAAAAYAAEKSKMEAKIKADLADAQPPVEEQ